MTTPPRFQPADLLGWCLALGLILSGWGSLALRLGLAVVIGVWTYRRFLGEPVSPPAPKAPPRPVEVPPPFAPDGTVSLATHGVLPLLVARGAQLGPLPAPAIHWAERPDWIHWSLLDDLAIAALSLRSLVGDDPLAEEILAAAPAIGAGTGSAEASRALAERVLRERDPNLRALLLLLPTPEAVARARAHPPADEPHPSAIPLALLLAAAGLSAGGLLSYHTYRRLPPPTAELCDELVRLALDRDPTLLGTLESAARERLAARAAACETGPDAS